MSSGLTISQRCIHPALRFIWYPVFSARDKFSSNGMAEDSVKALGNFKLLFLQDTNSFDLLRNAGVPEEKMIVAGDTRFDRVGSIAASAETDPKTCSMARR